MLFILALFTIYLCFCAKTTIFEPSNFSIEKTNLLKAVLPFGIIVHHLSFHAPQSVLYDFRFTGPYIVGLFFFMSGYGLEYQYHKGKIRAYGLFHRLKKLFVPFIIPTALYVCIVFFLEGQTLQQLFKDGLQMGNYCSPILGL